ncbi:CPBP family intramembrane glutamic endopeptidase [Rathayibacter sp. YIM 133350]|uniref:CPBP family intramembrane glutamic endopeptidase n=1 Tax=Rathayibacter sp. YIM 133350 TaxID=3131992 RepID=UPI00307F2588
MSTAAVDQEAQADRFGRAIERNDGRDFPYYDGIPVHVASWKWIVVILACVLGFALLILLPQPTNLAALLPRILFPLVPFVTFAVLVRPQWSAIFRRVTGRDVLTMVVFWLLNLAVTFLVGILVKALFGAASNPAAGGVGEHGAVDLIAFYLGTGIQLFGEELFTILPFLAVLYWMHRAGLGRKGAVLVAWLVTAVWFGAAHLPTYQWNVAQALLVIGVARLVLTLAFIRTKNIWVSTGAHILNDWATFTLVILTGLAVSAA